MSISFHKLPRLIQIEVIKSLEFAEIFCLSLTSTRTANVVRSLKFKQVSKLFYGHYHDQFDVYVEEHQESDMIPVGSVRVKRTRNFKYHFTTRLGANKLNFECQKDDDKDSLFETPLFYRSDPKKIVPVSMIEHAISLFGKNRIVFLYVEFDASFDDTPTVPSVTEMYFKSKKINAKCVRFLKNNPNLNYLVINGEWKVEPDFSEIPYLKITDSDKYAGNILRNFKGKNLVLESAKLSTRDILEFVKTWKANEGYQNFECIQIDFMTEIDGTNEAMDEIEFTEWDPNVRPENYEFCWPTYHKRKVAAFYLRDIRRDGDNQLASFYIWSSAFFFVVWK
ncbi:unnamed protein product [Caenorhabditis brenneri]